MALFAWAIMKYHKTMWYTGPRRLCEWLYKIEFPVSRLIDCFLGYLTSLFQRHGLTLHEWYGRDEWWIERGWKEVIVKYHHDCVSFSRDSKSGPPNTPFAISREIMHNVEVNGFQVFCSSCTLTVVCLNPVTVWMECRTWCSHGIFLPEHCFICRSRNIYSHLPHLLI